MTETTYDPKLLQGSADKWSRSAALRAWYGNLVGALAAWRKEGPTLELGSGIGAARDVFPELTTSDVVATPYADRVVDAYAIPHDPPWANLLAVDVLHHLRDPFRFFASASAALEPGGRLLLSEPAATPWGRLFYRLFHHEPINPAAIVPPFVFAPDDAATGEFANMGMARALFVDHHDNTQARLAHLRLSVNAVRYRDLFAYPATGGYSRSALLPAPVIRTLLAAERRLPNPVCAFAGLRMTIVLTRE